MKTKLIPLLLAALVFTACGGEKKDSSSAGDVKVDSKMKNEKQASELIGYTNGIIDYMNDWRTWMRTNDSKVVDTMKLTEDKRTGSTHSPLLPATFQKLRKIGNPPSSMGKGDKEFFTKSLSDFNKAFDAYLEKSNKLIQYFRAQDYKDDDYKKGVEISEEIQKERVIMFEAREAIMEKIRVLGDKAEDVLLQNSPIKEPIFAMKGEMSSIRALIGVFGAYANGEIDAAAVEAAYKKAEASVEKNKGQFKSVLEKNKKQKAYDAFYDQCDKALGDFRICLRKVKEGKELNRDNFNSLNSQMGYIISKYNSF